MKKPRVIRKLRACPFCGSDGECLDDDGYSVRCRGCGARGPDHNECDQFPHKNHTNRQAWNTRVDDAPGTSDVIELDAALDAVEDLVRDARETLKQEARK